MKVTPALSAVAGVVLLAGCASPTTPAVTVQVPTTVFMTGSERPPAATATSTEATAAAGDATPPVGSSVPFTWSAFGDDDQGVATLNTAEWSTKADPMSGPPKYGAYLIIDVTIKGTKGTVESNQLDWSVKDSEGRTYPYDFATGKDPSLATGDLTAGQKSRGYVAIDAPKGPVTVQLTNIGPALASWSVPRS